MKKTMAVAGVVLGLMAGGANAALFSRAGGTMVYDSVLDITWLADWNYASTSGYGTANVGGSGSTKVNINGTMGWDAAVTWANNLVYGGFGDWRLPTALDQNGTGPCSFFGGGNGCSDSEMGYMFYVNWGATKGNSYSTGTNTANLALFINVQVGNNAYWTDTVNSLDITEVWFFHFDNGFQGKTSKALSPNYAVAVRDGDVAPVPIPGTVALLGLGLVGIGAARRKQA